MWIIRAVIMLMLLASIDAVTSTTQTSADTTITTSVISSGATQAGSDFCLLKGTLRQTAIHISTGGDYVLKHGFWTFLQPCCIGKRGNVDGLSGPGGDVDVADLSYLIDFLFRGGNQPPCVEEGNVDGNSGPGGPIDVADLSYLVSYLFKGGAAPPPCEA